MADETLLLQESRFSATESTGSAVPKQLNETPREVTRMREPLSQEHGRQLLESEQRYQRQLEQAIQIPLVETRSSGSNPASRPIALLDEEARRSLSRPLSSAPSPIAIASPDTPADTRSETSDCIICFDGAQCVACLPCGHVAMCMDCAVHVKNSTRTCPVCRSCVKDIVRIYHV